MTKKRKLILVLSTLLILLIALMSIYLLFRVRTVKVNYKYSSQDINIPNEESIKLKVDKIIEDSNFRKNDFILFSSKEKAFKNIEENNKDIKIINIEKKFPGTIVIEVYKKAGLYSLKLNNAKYAILDEDLQLIRIQDTDNDSFIKITGVDINEEEVKKLSNTEYVGDYTNTVKAIKTLENNFEFLSNNKNSNVIENREKYYNFVKEIKIDRNNKEMFLITKNNFKIKYDLKIDNLDELIKKSLQYCKEPQLLNYLINITNNKKEEIRKQNYYIEFEIKNIDGKKIPEPKIVEE